MEEYLQLVTIDVWTMIFTWANLIILFFLLKKFLFRPINNILEERAKAIENSFLEAENTNAAAEEIKSEYESKLNSAHNEADAIIKSAVETANIRSEKIVSEASEKAERIIDKSQKQIETDRQNAVNAARGEIAAMAVMAAGKLIERSLNSEDDERLIADIIEKI